MAERQCLLAAFVPSRLRPRSPVGSIRSTTTHGRGRMSGSVCFQSFQKNSGGSTLIRKWCPLRACDSPLLVSLSPRVGPLLSMGVSAMAPKFQPENETEPERADPHARQGSSFNSRNPGSRREIFHQSCALHFLRTQQVTSASGPSPRAGSHAGIGVIWSVGQPLVAWPGGGRGRTNSVEVARGRRDALRSTESK